MFKRQLECHEVVSKSDPDSRTVKVRLSGADAELLQQYATHMGLPLSTGMRMLALDKLREWSVDKLEKDLERRKHARMLKDQLGGGRLPGRRDNDADSL